MFRCSPISVGAAALLDWQILRDIRFDVPRLPIGVAVLFWKHQMELAKACEPNQTPETIIRDVSVILAVFKDKPLDYAKGVLRQAAIAAEGMGVVTSASA